MKKIFAIFILMLFLILLGGCKKGQMSLYPSVIAWNDSIYGVSVEEVPEENIGKQLGEVKRVKKPVPVENGDANFISIGSKVFEIKDVDIKTAVAVEKEGKINKAFIQNPLK